MTIPPRRRFSVRIGLAEPTHDGPFEEVPDHLLLPLQMWVRGVLSYGGRPNENATRALCVRLRLTPPRSGNYLAPLGNAVGTELLDVVDEILAYSLDYGILDRTNLNELAELFDDAGSAYRVAENNRGLEERVTPAVRDAVRHTITEAATQQTAGSAADHLAASWQAAYGRSPDPVRAYSEAIKAAESAAHAVIQPNNNRATLGTMLGELKGARHKFTTALSTPTTSDAIAPVEAMMRALWEGQTSRHGGQAATTPETLEACRAAVHIAATIVQWFVSGTVTRTP
ncbi:hypothetical protein [Streptomyces sp. NPDC058657]|uniref:hypothetical protein n=1 Tax=unclassified Streptomyces TaxID=2593676 RepID=UPI00365B5888